ncbi:MAG TPA: cytochrome c [Stellaceae bacterium]|jgi:mono/diheme cytochrome c family protein|nr:cytochrome c [Stellaceae bacterium]
MLPTPTLRKIAPIRRLTLACGALLVFLAPARAGEAAVARGAYLAAAAGCDRCHTDKERHGQPYAGGRPLKTAYGLVPTPNITPDNKTGIGGWSLADFTRALRWGVAPDDSHYLPVFPFPYYAGLSDQDVADLKAFLDSLPPVSRKDTDGADSIALIGRARAAAAVALTPHEEQFRPDPAKDAAWNRGAYLAATVGRCGDCHTQRDPAGRPETGRLLGGSDGRFGGSKAPNITPGGEVGKWSDDDILTLLKEGQKPDFDFVAGQMAEIVGNTSRLTDDDRNAIVAYLRSVPPVGSQKK